MYFLVFKLYTAVTKEKLISDQTYTDHHQRLLEKACNRICTILSEIARKVLPQVSSPQIVDLSHL